MIYLTKTLQRIHYSDRIIPCSPSMSTTSTSTFSSPSPSPPPPRKGSIASMLNSIDELEQLDHENG
ncbi:unnamed protein product [Cunninghamella blakesleeana]